MARREIVVLQDDLNPSVEKDVRTIRFGFEGTDYEIDLGIDNSVEFAEVLAQYLAVARKVGKGKSHKAPTRAATAAEQRAYNQRVREFAKATGKEVSERGRVPAPLIEAYEAAGGDVGYRPAVAPVAPMAPVVELPKQAEKKAPAKKAKVAA